MPSQIDLSQVSLSSPTQISIPQTPQVVSLDDLNAQLNTLQAQLDQDNEKLSAANVSLTFAQTNVANLTQAVSDDTDTINAQQALIQTAITLGAQTQAQIDAANPIVASPAQPAPAIT